jgi:alanine dehydrogenase
VQARSHAHAVSRVLSLASIRVAGRTPERARSLAEALGGELEILVEAASSFEAACRGADVICAVTHSPEPVVRRSYVQAGAHITSVGYNQAGREIDSDTVADSLLVVESREAVLAPPPAGANDIRIPIEEGRITPDHIHAEIGQLVDGRLSGRTSPDQITLYKSVGVAAQDVAAASLVLAAAHRDGVGLELAL